MDKDRYLAILDLFATRDYCRFVAAKCSEKERYYLPSFDNLDLGTVLRWRYAVKPFVDDVLRMSGVIDIPGTVD